MDFCPTKLRHLKYQRIHIEFIYGIQITFRHAHPVVVVDVNSVSVAACGVSVCVCVTLLRKHYVE